MGTRVPTILDTAVIPAPDMIDGIKRTIFHAGRVAATRPVTLPRALSTEGPPDVITGYQGRRSVRPALPG
jgi:hypothetical protein